METKEKEMKSVDLYPMEDAIDRCIRMLYNSNGAEFRELFVETLHAMEFSFNQQWLRDRAWHVWKKWNSLHGNLVEFWLALDDTNKKVLAEMAKAYTGEEK